jgi:leucyl-tRNA synthetase
MAVPAHDERDGEFAQKYNLPSKQVIRPEIEQQTIQKGERFKNIMEHLQSGEVELPYIGGGKLMNSEGFNGMDSEEAKKKITEAVGGTWTTKFKLRDWVFSRQRYWGEPIPMIFCNHCKEKIESSALEVRFYEQRTWRKIVAGKKTVETRALNPEEPERYFGDIKEGDYLKFRNMKTNEERYVMVKKAKRYETMGDFFADKEMYLKMAPSKEYKNAKELEQSYAFTTDYIERIKNNGLVAWEFEHVIPGWVAVPEEQLPIELPHVAHYEPSDTGESPLATIDEWVNTTCPQCGGAGKRETDVMPNWAGSSWYYLRYTDPKNDTMLADEKKLSYWLPVDWYNGGMEHTTLHLLYSRFWHKFLYDIKVVPTSEPYIRRTSHGLILAEDGRKMSKSFGNVINPDDMIARFGADTLRTYEMFMGPFDQAIAWSTDGLVGVRRFLERVVRLKEKTGNGELSSETATVLHQTIKKVTEDIESLRMNTAISQLMICGNALEKEGVVPTDAYTTLLSLLAPFAPFLSEELWEAAGATGSVHAAPWPSFDPEKLVDAEVVVAVQVNGKLRGSVQVNRDTDEATVLGVARSDEKLEKWLSDKDIVKVIYVPNRVLNLVVRDA